jgi:hypothetical protein
MQMKNCWVSCENICSVTDAIHVMSHTCVYWSRETESDTQHSAGSQMCGRQPAWVLPVYFMLSSIRSYSVYRMWPNSVLIFYLITKIQNVFFTFHYVFNSPLCFRHSVMSPTVLYVSDSPLCLQQSVLSPTVRYVSNSPLCVRQSVMSLTVHYVSDSPLCLRHFCYSWVANCRILQESIKFDNYIYGAHFFFFLNSRVLLIMCLVF